MTFRIFTLSICLLFSGFHILTGQNKSLNAALVSRITFPQNENCSGNWGFQKDGIPYSLIGSYSKTNIFSLEDPTKPILRYEAFGAPSIWREMKVFNDHVYVATDRGKDGVTIIDMTQAPEKITHTNFNPKFFSGSDSIVLNTCHSIYIDEKGFMYLTGCNIKNRGVLIFDLNIDPKKPIYKGTADLAYCHDAFARGDTLYASEITIGKLSIYDVKDKSNPVLLTSQVTSRAFTHNAWPTNDNKYIFTTDEKSGAYVDAYDISDYSNIRLVDRFRTLERENDGVIPHNAHYQDGYLIVSYYTDGVRVLDVHRPENMIEVAYYDTWEDPSQCHNGFSGCWGVFPYTGTNQVYASDINNGFFVIDVDYKRACYLEGKITNKDGIGVSNALVQIISDQDNKEFSAPSGVYRTGQVLNGTFKVRITHPDYLTVEEDVTLKNGEITILDVVMEKKKSVITEFEVTNDLGFIKSKVLLKTYGEEINLTTTALSTLKQSVLTSKYEIFIGEWGYYNFYNDNFLVSDQMPNKQSVKLQKGYQDNFELDLGWTTTSVQGNAGLWSRAKPRKTEFQPGQTANPGVDSEDVGNKAFVTGNGLPGAGCDDVDNNIETITSPVMKLRDYNKPMLNYDVWFFNAGGATPINDTLFIKLHNGQQEVVVDKIFGTTDGWLKVRDIDVKSFIEVTDSMKLIVSVSDQDGSGHIVEAGFDNFFVTDFISSVSAVDLKTFKLMPNPVSDYLIVRMDAPENKSSFSYTVQNTVGQVLLSGLMDFHASALDVSQLAPGIYTIQMTGYKATKFVKL